MLTGQVVARQLAICKVVAMVAGGVVGEMAGWIVGRFFTGRGRRMVGGSVA